MTKKRFFPLRFKRLFFLTFASCLLATAFIVGCSLDSGNSVAPPANTSGNSEAWVASEGHPQFVSYSQSSESALAKHVGGDDNYVEKTIRANRGGVLRVGDWRTMKAWLRIRPHSIPQDEAISMTLLPGGLLAVGIGGENGIAFGPDGVTFDPPAKLTIMGKGLVLPEGDLYLHYWSEDLQDWEATDQQVEVRAMGRLTLLGTEIDHFSHYAFGVRR